MIKRSGDWMALQRFFAKGQKGLKDAMRQALLKEGHALRKEIVTGLTRQAPGGEPIKPLKKTTIAARQMRGFSGTKALIVRGDLRNSINVVPRQMAVFIGVPRTARGRNGQGLVNIARVHEFGSRPTVIKVTPKMRRFLFALSARAPFPGSPGSGPTGMVILQVPARPFLRPAFRRFKKGVRRRFLGHIRAALSPGKKS